MSVIGKRSKLISKLKEPDSNTIKFTKLLHSKDENPLLYWKKTVEEGQVKRVFDEEIDGKVLQLLGSSTQVLIATPRFNEETIKCTYPWLYLVIKPIKDQVIIEIQILDLDGVRRNFRFDTALTVTKVRYTFAYFHLGLNKAWNCLEIFEIDFIESMKKIGNLPENSRPLHVSVLPTVMSVLTVMRNYGLRCYLAFLNCSKFSNSTMMDLQSLCSRVYGSKFKQLNRLQIHASCRLRSVYATTVSISNDEMPESYRLFAAKHITKEAV